MTHTPSPRPVMLPLLPLLAMLATAPWHSPAQAQACKLLPLQQAPCDLVSAEVVAQSLGVPAASLKPADHLKIMGKMPELTVCIYDLPDGGSVRVGQIAKSSPAAFDQRYRSQSDAEITAGMGKGTQAGRTSAGPQPGPG